MNFFDVQDQARRSSRRLVLAYMLATLIIVLGVTALAGVALYSATPDTYGVNIRDFLQANVSFLVKTALVTAVAIFAVSLYRTSVLAGGGGRVAADMGGTKVPANVEDPLRRRLRNVVEEMAIASGVPVPEIYVLEQEQGINAFAAGYSPSDAAVAVTRGTLELLDRNELQGVIAHEFSHILNGDMKLNIRLMGILFGIMVLGIAGRLVLRGSWHGASMSGRRSRSHPAVIVAGLGLVIIGAVGVFFARAIKAGVSRQREYLADASAVQFTRQTDGIANALKKIGGYSSGSRIVATDPEEISHMLFGAGAKLNGMFATHPPLGERIRALEPGFDERDYPRVDARLREMVADGAADTRSEAASGFAGGNDSVATGTIADSIGRPTSAHVDLARNLRQSIPESLYDAAHSSELSLLLAVALVIDRTGNISSRQFTLVQEQLGHRRAEFVQRFHDELGKTERALRLPLLEIAFPALKLRPAAEISYLLSLTARLIDIDGEVDLFEFCFYRIMVSNLGRSVEPNAKPVRAKRSDLRAAVLDLLRVFADYGHRDEPQRVAAFEAGKATLGNWASTAEFSSDREATARTLNRSLDVLAGLNPKGQSLLFKAITATASYDGKVAISEVELIRAVCAALDYPLPPILTER